jgi:hypothetical protein
MHIKERKKENLKKKEALKGVVGPQGAICLLHRREVA